MHTPPRGAGPSRAQPGPGVLVASKEGWGFTLFRAGRPTRRPARWPAGRPTRRPARWPAGRPTRRRARRASVSPRGPLHPQSAQAAPEAARYPRGHGGHGIAVPDIPEVTAVTALLKGGTLALSGAAPRPRRPVTAPGGRRRDSGSSLGESSGSFHGFLKNYPETRLALVDC